MAEFSEFPELRGFLVKNWRFEGTSNSSSVEILVSLERAISRAKYFLRFRRIGGLAKSA